jgi:hypothetical protein
MLHLELWRKLLLLQLWMQHMLLQQLRTRHLLLQQLCKLPLLGLKLHLLLLLLQRR